MRTLALLMVTTALFVPAGTAQADESCLSKDKTGMAWVHPFESALEKAKSENRLLLIKPVAFGTSQDGGW